MATCKECKFITPSPTGDPSTGICLVERMLLAETQKPRQPSGERWYRNPWKHVRNLKRVNPGKI